MIEGIEKLKKRFQNYENVDMTRPISKAILHVQAAAKAGCKAVSGELRESIFVSVDQKENHTVGTCYTNKLYAPYVEFGTGPKGQENHVGISPDVSVAYTQTSWWIHESQIDEETAEKYHWFYLDTPEGRFYQCTGQPARPFLYPALKDHKEEAAQIIQDEVRRQLK